MQKMFTMVNVTDMDRSVAFYRDTLRLPLRFQSPGWTEFDLGSTTLALHGGAKPNAAGGNRGEMIAGTVNIGFGVDDLNSVYEQLKSQGVRFVMEPTDRPDEGIRLAVFLDPDGASISIAQEIAHAQHS